MLVPEVIEVSLPPEGDVRLHVVARVHVDVHRLAQTPRIASARIGDARYRRAGVSHTGCRLGRHGHSANAVRRRERGIVLLSDGEVPGRAREAVVLINGEPLGAAPGLIHGFAVLLRHRTSWCSEWGPHRSR